MNSEAIYQALFDLSCSLNVFNTTSRRVRHFSELSYPEYPALFQGQGDEFGEQGHGLPTRWGYKPVQYLYVNAGNDTSVNPATIINPMIDAMKSAFAPNGPRNVQTLNGLVVRCWINKVELQEGVLGQIEVALIRFDLKLIP